MGYTISKWNIHEAVREYVNHAGTKLVTGHPRVFDTKVEALTALRTYLMGLPADTSWELAEVVEG